MTTFKIPSLLTSILLVSILTYSATSLSVTTESPKYSDTLKVRVGNFYPNYFMDKHGKWQGIDVELMEALLIRANLKYEFINLPWSRALIMAKKGDVDILMNVNISAERSNYFYWIGPERYTQLNLIVQEELKNLSIKNLDDLIKACQKYGKRFGYQQDVKYMPEFMSRLEHDPTFQNCMEATSQPLNDDKVLHNRLLGYFDEPLDIIHEKQLNPEYGLFIHPFVVIKEPVFFAISKASVDIPTLLKLKVAYESLIADGSLTKIRDRWLKTVNP